MSDVEDRLEHVERELQSMRIRLRELVLLLRVLVVLVAGNAVGHLAQLLQGVPGSS